MFLNYLTLWKCCIMLEYQSPNSKNYVIPLKKCSYSLRICWCSSYSKYNRDSSALISCCPQTPECLNKKFQENAQGVTFHTCTSLREFLTLRQNNEFWSFFLYFKLLQWKQPSALTCMNSENCTITFSSSACLNSLKLTAFWNSAGNKYIVSQLQ